MMSSSHFHLLVCLSSHGYGHFAMTAPILNALTKKYNLRLTLKTTLPEKLLRTRIDGEFSVIPESSDFGMVMHNSFDVDIEKSANAYRLFHQNYSEKVEAEAEVIRGLNPDLVLVNVPYLSIDAAYACGIPCVAYCSLNWLEIFGHYFKNGLSEEQKIKQQITDAYNRADVFMCPSPSMPMPQLTNVVEIGPVAKQVSGDTKLFEKTGGNSQSKMVLVSPGGVHTPVPLDNWPQEEGITWICSWPLKTSRQDIFFSGKNWIVI